MMDATAIVNLAMLALQAVLNVIAEIRGQAGLTDDQIMAAAQTAAKGNDALYQQLIAALGIPPPPAS